MSALFAALLVAAWRWHPDRPYRLVGWRPLLQTWAEFGALLTATLLVLWSFPAFTPAPTLLAVFWTIRQFRRLRLDGGSTYTTVGSPEGFGREPQDQDGPATIPLDPEPILTFPQRIRPTSQAVAVALDRLVRISWPDGRGGDQVASGVLVAADRVLTSRHVLDKLDSVALDEVDVECRSRGRATSGVHALGPRGPDTTREDWGLLVLKHPIGLDSVAEDVYVERGWFRLDGLADGSQGDEVLVLGCPGSRPIGGQGPLNSLEQDGLHMHYGAPTRRGMSGGPCLQQGKLVGIHKGAYDPSNNRGVVLNAVGRDLHDALTPSQSPDAPHPVDGGIQDIDIAGKRAPDLDNEAVDDPE